jgi:hypothetical protein
MFEKITEKQYLCNRFSTANLKIKKKIKQEATGSSMHLHREARQAEQLSWPPCDN